MVSRRIFIAVGFGLVGCAPNRPTYVGYPAPTPAYAPPAFPPSRPDIRGYTERGVSAQIAKDIAAITTWHADSMPGVQKSSNIREHDFSRCVEEEYDLRAKARSQVSYISTSAKFALRTMQKRFGHLLCPRS